VIAVREADRGPEVLVLQRSAQSPFLPGYVAFPGGATDPDDAVHAARWFGRADEASRACAVRELAEEVGLALTAAGLGPGGDDPFAAIDAAPPAVEQLPRIARWVAPEDVPVRFDARYFAVLAPGGLQPAPDGHEAARAWWARPRDLLEGWAAGRHKLYWPTYFTIRALADRASVEDLLGLRMTTREPEPDEIARLPHSTFWQS